MLTLISQLTKVYDDPTFIPTIGEEVTVHIVFSIMLYQYAIRNLDDPSQQAYLNEESNRHYHFSLSKFYDLTVSRTLQDAQAMTLICVHLRNFSKPEACWMLSSHTLNMIKELGFHRSHKVSENSTLSGYDIEIRKRVFYTILTLNAGLSGKLGRPMPMRLDDFDIEFPSPMDDDTLAECDMPLERRSGKCRHQIGLQSFRIHALYLEMYSLIYCVRRHPETYIGTVNSLQRKLASWVENLPPELRKGSNAAQSHEGRVFALYAEIWAIEFRMLLRHPAVSLTTDAAFNAESMRIGIESSKQMYTVVKQLKELKSLDTTWYNTAIFVLAITTMLYAAWEKRAGMTMRDLDDTKLQVEEWLSIMGEIGHLLGSGNRLRDAVKTVTDRSIALLASSIKPAQQSPHPQSQSQTPTYEQPRPQQYSNHPPQYPDPTQPHQHHHNPSPHPPQHPPNYNSTPYPAATQYYPVPPSTTSPYEPTPTPTAYPAALSSSVPGNLAGYGHQDPVDAPLLAAFAEQASAQAQAAGSNDDTWRYNNLQNGVQGHGGHVQAQNGQIGGGINVGGSAGWLMFSNAISGSPHDGSVNPGLDMNAVGADEGMSAAVLLELGQGSGQGQGGMGGQMGGSVKSEGGHVVVNRMGGLNAWPGIVLDVAHPHPKQHNGGGQM